MGSARKLGPYTLDAELGTGGMGTVYRAAAADGGAVALKVIHSHLVGKAGFRQRFEREVEIGRRVRHANVVATLGAGDVDGSLYLAMELVDGQTLRELLDELGSVPEELCLHIGREVAQALNAIHTAGAFHRDIKPENVLITDEHAVKVMDLGVALLADESLRLSQSGAFVGSVLYAAPEQFGAAEPDARADLYALGLLLYELATGHHPFQADDMGTVIQRQMTAKPRPPAELNPQLSPFFEEVVLNLMAKDRARRFGSAAELLGVLEDEEGSAWWQSLRRDAAGPLRRIRIPRETTLHGRDDELAQFRRRFDRCKDGQGQVLLVEGEAGIGKTRLVDEFAEQLARAGETFHFLVGGYPPGGAATAAGALSTAYREFLGAAGVHARLAAQPALIPGFAALLEGTPPPAGTPPLGRAGLFRAFALVTQALAAEQPTIIVLDDLHFAPEMGLAIFASLASAVADHRVLLIGTTRPGLSPQWVTNLERLDHAARVTLPRLSPKVLSQLLVELFRSEHLASELGWAIATKSDGNPFFVFELVRSLREDQLIERAPDGTWVQTRVIGDINVPSSLLDLVEARLRDLDETDKDLLEVASCCGFEFDPLLVAAALDIDQIPAMKRFAHLERKHRLVRAVGRRAVFDHHQVQEALYRGLPELLREPYHAKLGDALAARHPTPDGAVAVELCEHFLAGAQSDRVRPYLDAAVQHLTDGYLLDEAIALTDRALAVDGLLVGAERVELLLRNATSLERRGRHEADRAALDEARVLADELADPALQGRVRLMHGRLAIWRSEYDDAERCFAAAREFARAAGDQQTETAAIGNLGIVYYRQRRFDECGPLFEQVNAAARAAGDRRGMASATLNLGNVCWCRREYDAAQAHYERYRDLSREIGYREGEALAAGNLGNVFFALGRMDDARRYYEEVLEKSGAIGDRHKIALFETSLAQVDQYAGRPEDARRRCERALALARDIGMPREEAVALRVLAALASDDTLFEEALAIYRRVGEREGETDVCIALGRYDEAIRISRAGDDAPQLLMALALRARKTGDADEAVRMFEELRPTLTVLTRRDVAYALYRATGERAYLEDAQAMLDHLRAHAPAADFADLEEA